jgi:deoxyribonuclease V
VNRIAWPKTIPEAKALQNILKTKVRITPLRKKPRFITALDAAFTGDQIIGTACLYRYPELALVEEKHSVMRNLFPYVPGFLSFREGPVLIDVIGRLSINPDLILIDGQGIAHPLRLGLASHIGVLLNIPAIGCAKSRLIGDFEEPAPQRGDWSPLIYNADTVGAVLRTRDNVRPLFISPGHKIDLQTSIEIVLDCVMKYRIPEPLRRADLLSKRIKREIQKPHFGRGGKGGFSEY